MALQAFLAEMEMLLESAPAEDQLLIKERCERTRVFLETPDPLKPLARIPLWHDQREAWREIVDRKPPQSKNDPGKNPITGNTQP